MQLLSIRQFLKALNHFFEIRNNLLWAGLRIPAASAGMQSAYTFLMEHNLG
jgi:hypothetical protein